MKHRSNAYSITQSNLLGNSTDRIVHYKRTGRMGARKYLRESYCHRIECSAADFLAVFMWRRPLNSVASAIPTHRGPKGVSDGINTQVVAWMINKCRIKIRKMGLYNIRDPPWREDEKKSRKKHCSNQETNL